MTRETESRPGLRFSVAAMKKEVDSLARVAKPFLEVGAFENTIRPWLGWLENFMQSPVGTQGSWAIPASRPLRTAESDREFQPDQKGSCKLVGTISCVWDLEVVAPQAARKQSKRLPSDFSVVGKASTRVSVSRITSYGQNEEVLRWRFEIGDSQSPGCHFHVQVLGEDDDIMFPKEVDVPRLPSVLVTPMDALDFLLAEMFQDRWRQHVSQETDALRIWTERQKSRLASLLQWQLEVVRDSNGPPWTTLKRRKPEHNLLFV